MRKLDIVLQIAEKKGVEQLLVRDIVQMTLDSVIDVLVTEGRLELRDFGVFEVRVSKPRKARNPKTGEKVMVPERRRVVFKAGKVMKQRVGNNTTTP